MEITKDTRVSEILKTYGDIAEVMKVLGVKPVGGYSLRALVARFITVKWAARIHRELADRGEPIGNPDCLIAGICLTRDAVLLTNNRPHFEKIDGLHLGTLTL